MDGLLMAPPRVLIWNRTPGFWMVVCMRSWAMFSRSAKPL